MFNKVMHMIILALLFITCARGTDSLWDERNISRTEGLSQTPFIAVDGNNNIYISWPDAESGKEEVYFRERINGEWSDIVVLDSSNWGISNTNIVIDSRSNLHVVYENDGAVYYLEREGGVWKDRVMLSDSGESCSQPCLGIDSLDNLYVIWDYQVGSEWGMRLMKKVNDTWKGRFLPGFELTNPRMYVSPGGEIHIVAEGAGQVHYYHSSDGGENWDRIVRFPNNRPGGGEYYDWLPSVVEEGGYVYVFWTRSIVGGIKGMYYSVKPPGGEFGDTTRVEMDMEEPNFSCVEGYNGYIYLVWRETDGSQTEVYLSKRRVPDGAWSEPYNVSHTETNSIPADMFVVKKGVVYVVWGEEFGYMDYDIYFDEIAY
ncbi:hypothetical protein DRQ23_07080 [bacterium]|nr:MAG: hypothetical protein DRQ23_07080 [bacterium]